jgi:hypothetical protein
LAWNLYNRPGKATINGEEREGFAWFRDTERRLVAFSALTPRAPFDPAADEPPESVQQLISEYDFTPLERRITARSLGIQPDRRLT